MVALELKGLVGARIDSSTVCQHICEWVDLSKDGSISHDLFLDVIDFLSEAEVHHFVEVVAGAAFVLRQVLVWAFVRCTGSWEARFGEEALALAPGEHFVDRAAVAAAILIAVDQLLA